MDQESFDMSPAARRVLDDYLDQVERQLTASGLERQQRRSIADDLEAQILEMLQERTAQARQADVRAVLARLDAPEDYARAAAENLSDSSRQAHGSTPSRQAEPTPASPTESGQASAPRLAPYALAGVGMLCPIFFFTPMAFGGGLLFVGPRAGLFRLPFLGQWSLFATLPFLTLMCIFGLVAIQQIRQSEGRLYGMGLAVFDALLLPLLLLDGALLTFFRLWPTYFAWNWQAAPLVPVSRIVLLLCLLALDCVIGWWVWDRLRQPSSAGQPRSRILQSHINIP